MPISKRFLKLTVSLSPLLLSVFLGVGILQPVQPLLAQEPAHSPGWVVLSVPDYRALRVKAFPADAIAVIDAQGLGLATLADDLLALRTGSGTEARS